MAVGRLENSMWRSYYEHRPVRLFADLVSLMRTQYRLPFWRSVEGAYHATRAAVVFQKGHDRSDYEKALPDLASFYSIVRRGSDVSFDTHRASRLELEWWIAHRHRLEDLADVLAALQAEIFQMDPAEFLSHAELRAEAMRIRDRKGKAVSEEDWRTIGGLLERSWTTLQTTVATASASPVHLASR